METSKELAKKIRGKLKKEFPNIPARHFSIRTDYDSVKITWKDYPTREQVAKIALVYHGKTFDGMRDEMDYHGYIDPDTGERVDSYNSIRLDFDISDEREDLLLTKLTPDEVIDPVTKQPYERYSYRLREKLYKINGQYSPTGELLPEYVELELDDEDIWKMIRIVALESIDIVKSPVPEVYIKHEYPQVGVTNYIVWGDLRNQVLDEITSYLSEKVFEDLKLSNRKTNTPASIIEKCRKYAYSITHPQRYSIEVPSIKNIILSYESFVTEYINKKFEEYRISRGYSEKQLKDATDEFFSDKDYTGLTEYILILFNNQTANSFNTIQSALDFPIKELLERIEFFIEPEIEPEEDSNIQVTEDAIEEDTVEEDSERMQRLREEHELEVSSSEPVEDVLSLNKPKELSMNEEIENILRREYFYLLKNQDLYTRVNRILSKRVAISQNATATILETYKRSPYYKNYMNVPFLLSSVQNKMFFLTLPHAFFVFHHSKGKNNVVEVYNLRKHTIKECQENYKGLSRNIGRALMISEKLYLTGVLVENLSLRG